MLNTFRKLFERKTVAQFAADELHEAELALLKAQTGQEWAAAEVTYNLQRIKRLKKTLADASAEES